MSSTIPRSCGWAALLDRRQKGTEHVNSNSTGRDRGRIRVLLVMAASAAVAMQSEAWASAVGTAVTFYAVLTTDSQRN
ncbi:hypothetical protein SALBM135S_01252 [Streptomyces alboniger]